MVAEQDHPDRAAAARAAADLIAAAIDEGVAARDGAVCVVSGGTSPVGTFQELRGRRLPWPKVTFTLTDERLVRLEHRDSNAGMLKRELLAGDAGAAAFVPLYRGTHRLEETEADIRGLAKPYDVVLLGMGADGHIASLFPHAPGLADKLASENATELAVTTHQESVRLTLTPKELLNTRHIVLLFFGEEKQAVFRKAQQAGSVIELPVRLLLQQDAVPVTVIRAP